MLNQTRLLIDAGNSRIKWAFADDQSEPYIVNSHTDLASAVKGWKAQSKPVQVWLASVRNKQFNDELSSAIQSLWTLPTNKITSTRQALGVTNAYAEPEQLGCDRWAAMLAAFHQSKTSLVVVNLGTALTIDAIDADGQHLGGLICPGIHLQQAILNKGTNINVTPDGPTHGELKLFAASTAEGISSGSIYALSALIDKAYQNRLSKDPGTVCYLAGGDAENIADTLQCPCIIEPSLVLKGIALLAAAR